MKNDLDTNTAIGRAFEEEVRDFLKEVLGCVAVNGGAGFHIGNENESNQIDACGRHEDTLLVFECKATGKRTKKDLRGEILKSATKAKIAYQNYRKIPEYRSCKNFRYIFITKKIDVPDENKTLCIQHSMFYEDDGLLEYYRELHSKIGKYSVYNFLADYNIFPAQSEYFEVPALKAKMGEYTVYNFYALPKDLLKFSYVARRRNGKEDFYQRMLDTTRIKKIQHFLDEGGIFPTNIVLSLRKNELTPTFEFKGIPQVNKTCEIGVLSTKNTYNAFWIIDGQHRLYSFANSTSNTPISCIAFQDLSIEKERGFFLEINKEQRPIQADLIWDLEGLSAPDSYRGKISNIVRTLNKYETGPFYYKIYIPLHGSKDGRIVNMAAFCNGLNNSSLLKEIPPNFLGMANPLLAGEIAVVNRRVANLLAKYFSRLQDDLSENHCDFIFGNAGIPIMLYLLEPILAHLRRVPRQDDLNRYTKAISYFFDEHYKTTEDLKRLKTETNSEGARKNLARQIGLGIRREIRDKMFWPQMEQNELSESIISIERRLSQFIAKELSDLTSNWEKERVPEAIRKKCQDRMSSDGTRFEENFNLGEICEVIVRKDNWEEVFQGIFVGKNKFENQDEFKLVFRYLSKIRNPFSHGKVIIHTKDTLDQCELHLRRLDKILPKSVIALENN